MTIDTIANDVNFMFLWGVEGSMLNNIEDLLAAVFNGCLRSHEVGFHEFFESGLSLVLPHIHLMSSCHSSSSSCLINVC